MRKNYGISIMQKRRNMRKSVDCIRNCINCGAPITGTKCQYCGTEYSGKAVAANFSDNDYTGVLSVGGNEYKVYISRVETNTIVGENAGRTLDGKVHFDRPKRKHVFTLIEL